MKCKFLRGHITGREGSAGLAAAPGGVQGCVGPGWGRALLCAPIWADLSVWGEQTHTGGNASSVPSRYHP